MSLPSLSPGELFAGRFELLAIGGTGGMATVYRARDRRLGRDVALKVLQHDREKERFVAEAETLAAVRSPHVVGYVAHGEGPHGRAFLAMDWLEGEDLDRRLRRGAIPLREAVDLVMRVARGLGAAHRLGIVHRDVKPENVLLIGGELAEPRVVDFGIARLPGRRFTEPGLVLGTPGFFAPEQARAESVLDPRADVFALGCVLHECITGQPLWEGDSVVAILTKILFAPAPRLDRSRTDVPTALADLVERMLDKDPRSRPEHGDAVADALLEIDLRETAMEPPAVLPPARPRAIGERERAVASVLVARLPKGALTPMLSRSVREIGAQFGATCEELADGSLAALITGARAATDLAAIAVRLALAIQKALSVRSIAVATGRATLGESSEIGAVIARASRLASVDTARALVHIDATTARLLDDRFPLTSTDQGLAVAGDERSNAVAAPTLRGRTGELALVLSRFDAALAAPRAAGLVLLGDAGIGKTALFRAAVRTMADREALPTIFSARGEPLRENAAFGLVAELLRGAMALEAVPEVGAMDAIATWIGARLDGPDATRAIEVCADLLRVGGGERSVSFAIGHGSAGSFADRVEDALCALILAECRGVPVLLALEDLQFADPPSVAALAALLRRLENEPLFLLATARPSALERSSTFFAIPTLGTLPVLPLPVGTASAWARDVLGADVSLRRVEEIVRFAEGNPFVLGELLRAARGGEKGAPRAVVAALHGRLESFAPPVRRALRAASVCGAFDADDVAHVTGAPDAQEALESLVADDVLVRDASSGTVRYAFKNRLLQEVAYGMLTAEDRALAHALAAERLASRGGAAALVAEHLSRAGQSDGAAPAFALAAREALLANDLLGALSLADRGLALSPPKAVRADLLASHAEAALWQGDPAAGRVAAEEALALASKGTLAEAAALSTLATALGRLGEADGLEALASEIVLLEATPDTAPMLSHGLARAAMNLIFMGRFEAGNAFLTQLTELRAAVPGPVVEARWAQVHSVRAHYEGDLAGHFRWAERALALFDQLGDRRIAAVLRANVGDALRSAGKLDEAELALRAALEAAHALGIGAVEGPVRANLGLTLCRVGRLDEALAELDTASEMFHRASDRRLAASAAIYRAEVHLARADAAAATEAATTALALADVGTPLWPNAQAMSALAALAMGRLDAALVDAEAALASLELLAHVEDDELVPHLALAEVLLARGDRGRGRAVVRRACARLDVLASKLGDPELRRTFLTNVPAHRRLLELAATLGDG